MSCVLQVSWPLFRALDCRWDREDEDRHDFTLDADRESCTGACWHIAMELLDNNDRLHDILQGAQRQGELITFCKHGKHRSLGAALIIRVLCGSDIEADYPDHWCRACDNLNGFGLVECLLNGSASIPAQPGPGRPGA